MDSNKNITSKDKSNGSSLEEQIKTLAIIQQQLLKDKIKSLNEDLPDTDEDLPDTFKYKKMLRLNQKAITKINESIKIKKR